MEDIEFCTCGFLAHINKKKQKQLLIFLYISIYFANIGSITIF